MTAPHGLASINAAVLSRSYDLGAISRGRNYATEGRVFIRWMRPDSVEAVVAGSGHNAYEVWIGWSVHGDRLVVHDECSCPLGGRCKHAVATILVAQGDSPAQVPAIAPWRTALTGVVGTAHEPTRDTDAAPVALQVTVEYPAATRWSATPEPRVMLRPVRLGAKGTWLKIGISWRDLRYDYGRHSRRNLDSGQVDALRKLLVGARLDRTYTDPAALAVTSFGSDLWYLLDQVQRAGVALVGADGDEHAVAVGRQPAEGEVALAAADDDGIAVRPRLLVDGTPLEIGDEVRGVLGDPAHGLYHERNGVLHLVRLAEPYPANL